MSETLNSDEVNASLAFGRSNDVDEILESEETTATLIC
jgi:hypothetical protein